MQIRKVPQSCHSGKRWIWILEALSNTNQSKKLTVPTISGFHFWQLDYIGVRRRVCIFVSNQLDHAVCHDDRNE